MKQNPIRYAFALLVGLGASLSAHAGMTISSPGNGSTVSNPMHVVAKASSSQPITSYKIYVDGNSVYTKSASSIDTYVNTSTAGHKVTVKAWDTSGVSVSASISVTVTSTSSGSTPPTTTVPSSATSFSHIEEMSGWGSCTGCAGAGGNATYTVTQYQSSPSLDGKSTKIALGGSTPFSHALIWRRMGASTSATHFIFDMSYMIGKPSASQGLEFAANQSLSSGWYKFSTQCSFGNGTWSVWNSKYGGWVSTGIACTRPAANTWQHVTFEYARANGKAVFVSITINGTKHYVNKSFYPQSKSGDGSVGIHFQTNGNATQDDYTTWIDKLSFQYW